MQLWGFIRRGDGAPKGLQVAFWAVCVWVHIRVLGQVHLYVYVSMHTQAGPRADVCVCASLCVAGGAWGVEGGVQPACVPVCGLPVRGSVCWSESAGLFQAGRVGMQARACVCVGLDPRGGGVPIRGDAQLFPVGPKASGSWRYFHTPSLSQVDWGLRQSSQPWGWCVSGVVRTPVYV